VRVPLERLPAAGPAPSSTLSAAPTSAPPAPSTTSPAAGGATTGPPGGATTLPPVGATTPPAGGGEAGGPLSAALVAGEVVRPSPVPAGARAPTIDAFLRRASP
jgi:hypothetical protein